MFPFYPFNYESFKMSKIASVVFTTQKQDAPHGVVMGGFSVSLMLAGVIVGSPVVVADAAVPVTFSIDVPGDYTVDVVRIAESGERVSPVVTSTVFTVAPAQIDVPLSVTVVLGDPPAAPKVDVPAAVAVAVS